MALSRPKYWSELPNVNGVVDSRGHDKALGLLEDSERLLKSRPHYCCCSVTQSYLTLYDSIECSTPGLSVPHHFPKFSQVHIHRIGDATQPSHPLTPSSPSALNFSQHQGLFQWKLRPVYCRFPCASNDTFSGSMWWLPGTTWYIAASFLCYFFAPLKTSLGNG